MTIIIPYKDEVHKGKELKYALRGIEKNLSGWNDIWLVGQPPIWYNGNSIPAEDYPGRKEYSCYQKLLMACYDDRISEDFIYYNDDHFLLKPLHISAIENWFNGSLRDEVQKPHSARWRIAAENTIALMVEGVPNFDIHVPMIFDKDLFAARFRNLTQEICIKTYYNPQDCTFMEDCNLSSQLTYSEIKQAIEGKLFCSSKGGITKEYFRVLEELFPEPSRFEL